QTEQTEQTESTAQETVAAEPVAQTGESPALQPSEPEAPSRGEPPQAAVSPASSEEGDARVAGVTTPTPTLPSTQTATVDKAEAAPAETTARVDGAAETPRPVEKPKKTAPDALAERAPPPKPAAAEFATAPGVSNQDGETVQQAALPVPAPSKAEVAPVAPKTPVVSEAPSRITIRARMDSWFQIRDEKSGDMLATRLLRTGDSYAVPGNAELTLITGNAGALEILVDGKEVPAIGEVGTVRRGVALDAERLQQGKAVIE
ncbi:MAG: DUF4115 domain-containing protein, partial [Rhodospirillales bacterium]|nr:DUF4115 domain-containing protein [Rhodospirillales bacterium]